jgi:hypothetical protein
MADWETITEGQVTGASTNTVTLSAIPQTYQHLELTISARVEDTNYKNLYVNFNGDGGTNYGRSGWGTTGSTTPFRLTEWQSTSTRAMVGYAAGNNFSTGAFAAINIIIPNYTNTDDYKVCLSRGGQGMEDFTDGFTTVLCGGWASNTAITSVSFFALSTPNFTAGTSYLLAGYKG